MAASNHEKESGLSLLLRIGTEPDICRPRYVTSVSNTHNARTAELHGALLPASCLRLPKSHTSSSTSEPKTTETRPIHHDQRRTDGQTRNISEDSCLITS